MAKPLRLQIFAAGRRLLPWVAIGCVLLALSPCASELKLSLSRISASSLVIALGLSLAYWFLERFQALPNQPLRRRALWRSSLVYVGLNAFHGLGLWLMLSALGYSHSISPAAAIGANATGWLLGFFAIGIPGGIGVREAGVALVLSPLIPWQEATLAAGLWRIVQIAAELFALLPWLFIRGGTGKKKILPAPINGHLLEELLATAQLNYDEARVDAAMSDMGMPKSKQMAQNAIVDAESMVAQREQELKFCSVISPASGTIDRVLLSEFGKELAGRLGPPSSGRAGIRLPGHG